MGKTTEAKVAAVEETLKRYMIARVAWDKATAADEVARIESHKAGQAAEAYSQRKWKNNSDLIAREASQDAEYLKLDTLAEQALARRFAAEKALYTATQQMAEARQPATKAMNDLEAYIKAKERKLLGGKKSLPRAKEFLQLARGALA